MASSNSLRIGQQYSKSWTAPLSVKLKYNLCVRFQETTAIPLICLVTGGTNKHTWDQKYIWSLSANHEQLFSQALHITVEGGTLSTVVVSSLM